MEPWTWWTRRKLHPPHGACKALSPLSEHAGPRLADLTRLELAVSSSTVRRGLQLPYRSVGPGRLDPPGLMGAGSGSPCAGDAPHVLVRGRGSAGLGGFRCLHSYYVFHHLPASLNAEMLQLYRYETINDLVSCKCLMAVTDGIEPSRDRHAYPDPGSNRGRYRFRLMSPRLDGGLGVEPRFRDPKAQVLAARRTPSARTGEGGWTRTIDCLDQNQVP